VSVAGRELRTTLTNKLGFAPSGRGRGPHDKYRLYVDGQWVAHTQVPRGSKAIGDELIRRIARQLRISSRELHQIIDCSLDRDGYLAKVM
jgi:hypothetical protein